MKPKEIRAALILAEVHIKTIAKRMGCSQSLVHKVINGERFNAEVRAELAKTIARAEDDIWPPQQQAA